MATIPPSPIDLWVDFNEVSDIARTTTLRRFASPGVRVILGRWYLVGDGEANTCEGRVVGTAGDLVMIELDVDTFRPAPWKAAGRLV